MTELFQRYGKILNSKIIRNSNNTSKGYGFVTFVDDVSATKVKNLANQDSNKFFIGNCSLVIRDARKKGFVRHVTRCAIPSFHVPSRNENLNQDNSQKTYCNNEHQPALPSLPAQNDGLIGSQNDSPQQFLTPPPTPTNISPSLPPTFIPSFGYYQYPYQQYPCNPYFQVGPQPYQVYQYTHVSHPQNFQYTQQNLNVRNYGNEYDNEHGEVPIVTIESDDEENI